MMTIPTTDTAGMGSKEAHVTNVSPTHKNLLDIYIQLLKDLISNNLKTIRLPHVFDRPKWCNCVIKDNLYFARCEWSE